ncbi:MAG: hypothetical protein RIE58_01905 [Vicingaceae bacterium]
MALSFFGVIDNFPMPELLKHWDANWYSSIAFGGYNYIPGDYSNVVFFPLFPYLWRYSFIGPLGISLLNGLFTLTGLFFIQKTIKFSFVELLLFLSIPSLFFCYVPFSEGLFFLCGSLIVYGLKNNFRIALLGVCLACLTRSSSFVFIPAFIILFVLNFRGSSVREELKKLALLMSVALAATFMAQLLIFFETGEFFAMFKVQEIWNRTLSVPQLPFTTWGGAKLLWLDGLALLVGVMTTLLLIVFLFRKFMQTSKTVPSHYLFSVAYLCLVSIVAILFSGLDDTGVTTLMSLNRYVFATPFFTVLLAHNYRHQGLTKKSVRLFFVSAIIALFLLGICGEIPYLYVYFSYYFSLITSSLLYFLLMLSYASLYLLFQHKMLRSFIFSGLYLINLLLQIILFTNYLSGNWVG